MYEIFTAVIYLSRCGVLVGSRAGRGWDKGLPEGVPCLSQAAHVEQPSAGNHAGSGFSDSSSCVKEGCTTESV